MATSPHQAPKRYLVDTNVLVALSLGNLDVMQRIEQIERLPARFFIGLQDICEFWNVSTRPTQNNGLGLSPELAHKAVERILIGFQVLPETKQVLLRAHELDGILTFNIRDFVRHSGSNPIHPSTKTP